MTRFQIDTAHSSVDFTVRHLVISKVRGRFARWQGSVELDAAAPERARIEVAIDAASVDTGVEERDRHLRSPDFLDVAQHPSITFRSTKVTQVDGAAVYRVDGELTIHGVTRPVALEVEGGGRVRDPWGGERIAWSARAHLDRRDFGLTWNQLLEAGGVLVGDRIEVGMEIEAIEQAAEKVVAA
jgi:polyisoprenoid-binding protein YceI